MKLLLKSWLRRFFIALQWPVTKNIQYDICTQKILKQALKPNSNCVDVGAHKGEILDLFLRYSPDGSHVAFEPIPYLFSDLRIKYPRVKAYPYALSDSNGTATFNLVLSDPAYSGLKKRKYKNEFPQIEIIQVETKKLDDVLAGYGPKIDLIKIDVEGGELGVLRGAQETLKQHKPIVIFEFGKGASEFYGTTPDLIYDLLQVMNYRLYTMTDYLTSQNPLTLEKLAENFDDGVEYYFVAKYH